MKTSQLLFPALSGLALLGACAATPPPPMDSACMAGGSVVDAEVLGFEGDSVIVMGPDGPYNMSMAYLNEMPRVGDKLRITQEYVDNTCQPVVYDPAGY